MHKVVTVQGMQFGSEAKGNIAALVAQLWCPDTVVTAWGPNAGHTAYIDGVKYVHTMLPVGALAKSVQTILLGPGSVINVEKLIDEIRVAAVDRRLLEGKDLIIHPQATILMPHHAYEEAGLVAIGSTMKGTMAATTQKMRRDPTSMNTARALASKIFESMGYTLTMAGMSLSISSAKYDSAVDDSERMLVEGAQGFSLGMHNDFYPFCTSRDVSTAQLFADCRLPLPRDPWLHTIGVFRTYPIRVANRYKKHDDGTMEQVGTSGAYYPDQIELEWSQIDREPELTTVTRLPRRLFTLSKQQLLAATRVMRPDYYAFTFCDYLMPKDRDKGHRNVSSLPVPPEVKNYLAGNLGDGVGFNCIPQLLSFGPETSDILEISPSGITLEIPTLGYLP